MESLTHLLNKLSDMYKISLSTLKLNAKVLKELQLIYTNGFIEITETGKLVRSILGDDYSKASK